jgi:hypothetical protein
MTLPPLPCQIPDADRCLSYSASYFMFDILAQFQGVEE